MPKQRAKALLERMLPFWQNLRDEERGGFYGLLDENLVLHKDADKGCILHGRILWFFSTAARVLSDDSLLPYARHAYVYLRDVMRDSAEGREGGMFWSVHADGTPGDTEKYTYALSFVMYGLSAYYRASGEKEALDLAQAVAFLLEHGCRDEHGYIDALTRDFTPLHYSYKLSENGILASRTMNTLLHVIESYVELVRACDADWAKERLRRDLEFMRDKVYLPAERRLNVFYDDACRSLLDIHSYGHDIEAAWLLDDAAEALGDEAFAASLHPMTDDLAKKVYERAYRDASVTAECAKGEEDERRIWWVQAEAVNGFLNHHRKHPGEAAYRNAALAVLGYIEQHFIDPRPGSEWFSELDAKGVPIPGKAMADAWKCPYHNGRTLLMLL